MGLPILDRFVPEEDEWRDVPIYTGIKQVAEPWIREGFDIHAIDTDKVPEDGGAILAANHASYFDPIFLGAVVDRPVSWMAKATLFRHPVTDFFFKKAGQVKVDRVSGGNEAAVDRCVELARDGRVVGIFPEGSRTMDGSLRRGRTGVARVALRSELPVIPVAMTSFQVLPKHTLVPDLDGPLVIALGDPITYEGMSDRAQDRDTCRKITEEIMSEIGRLLEIARTRREALLYEEEA